MEAMSMKTYKLLVVVAFVGVAIASEAGNFLKQATEDTKPVAMGECLATCNDAACMRKCIANVEGRQRPRAGTQQSLDDCFGEALSNITSCSAVILLRGDDAKYDVHFAFWTCVNVASLVFDQCPAGDLGLNVESETMLRKNFLGHLVDAAEDGYKLFLAGKLTAYRLNVVVSSNGGGMSPPSGRNAEGAENQPDKFLDCLFDFSDNLISCENQCGSNGTCLTGCQSVAVDVFWNCTGVTPTG